MDEHTRAFLDRLIRSNFAEFKGSSAELHLQIPETILNDLLQTALESRKAAHPWLALVDSARVEGTVRIDVKLAVP
jgi:hypothetical protein